MRQKDFKGNRVILVTFIVLCTFFFHTTVYANSSWQWVTDSPKEMLPLAILLTLTIEILGILYFCFRSKSTKTKLVVIAVIIVANITSFVFPYVLRAMDSIGVSGGWNHAWKDAFESGPYYIVFFEYFFLTLVVEIPILLGFAQKFNVNKKVAFTVLSSFNLITTVIVATLERIKYYGHW